MNQTKTTLILLLAILTAPMQIGAKDVRENKGNGCKVARLSVPKDEVSSVDIKWETSAKANFSRLDAKTETHFELFFAKLEPEEVDRLAAISKLEEARVYAWQDNDAIQLVFDNESPKHQNVESHTTIRLTPKLNSDVNETWVSAYVSHETTRVSSGVKFDNTKTLAILIKTSSHDECKLVLLSASAIPGRNPHHHNTDESDHNDLQMKLRNLFKIRAR